LIVRIAEEGGGEVHGRNDAASAFVAGITRLGGDGFRCQGLHEQLAAVCDDKICISTPARVQPTVLANASAMVGMARKNGRGSVELFGKDDPRKLMRQGYGPKGDLVVGRGQQRSRQPVRPADGEGGCLGAIVAKPCQ
jgi:hypothetical protein